MSSTTNTTSETPLPAPVLMVEDNPEMRERLRDILFALGYSADALIQAETVAEALAQWEAQPAALALIDLGLPDGNGQELVRRFHQDASDLPIVVVTTFTREEAILSALEAGAIGYVLKDREDVEIKLALRSVFQGGAPIDPFVAQRLLKVMSRSRDEPPESAEGQEEDKSTSETATANLTPREVDVLERVAEGLSNREIASQLCKSTYTIQTHIKHIYQKLAVKSRVQAVQAGRSQGLLPLR